MATVVELKGSGKVSSKADSRDVIQSKRSKEIFFAVVGPVGAGGSRVLSSLQRACQAAGYKCERIKASDLIRAWATAQNWPLTSQTRKTLEGVAELQDAGDEMRKSDTAEVARAILREIAQRRAKATKQTYQEGEAVQPDTERRAYLIESIRHPAEISLLRRTYAHAFALIGVVCEESERTRRILGKYFTDPERHLEETKKSVREFMSRDADDPAHPYGQHVTEAFFESDFFVDNSQIDEVDEHHYLDEPVGRLLSIVTHNRIVRPTIEETAMHHAHSARVRSACLSRQVGAALVDGDGTVVATGVNEVPKPGGGVYGESFGAIHAEEDHRCAFRGAKPFCSSNREQNKIVEELIAAIPELSVSADKESLAKRIRKTRLGGLIEFSRAVHAEMDALLSAGREGVSTVGTRLFVTTYPCHYCARHIVSAGVYEVQFIEPYPKSLAVHLHSDAIEAKPASWHPPEVKSIAQGKREMTLDGAPDPQGKVLFHPFVGVAPRLYVRAFEKTWRLKDKVTGEMEMEAPEWGDEWAPFTVAYPELEAALTKRP